MNVASEAQATADKTAVIPPVVPIAHQKQAGYPGQVPLGNTLTCSFQISTSADSVLPMGT